MRDALAWLALLALLMLSGPLLVISGALSYRGIAPDVFLGAVLYFHLAGRLREMRVPALITICLLAAAASVGGTVPLGARLAGYALALLVMPPADAAHKRPLFFLMGIGVREAAVLFISALVLKIGGGPGSLSAGESIITLLLTMPCAAGVFYVLAGTGSLIGLRLVPRHYSHPDALAGSSALDRVAGRADIREA